VTKHYVALVKPMGGMSHQESVSRFHADAERVCTIRQDLEPLIYCPDKKFPTDVARNHAADGLLSLQKPIQPTVVFMIDDDMWVEDGCFEVMLDFLLNHHGPAVIGLPYCTGGLHEMPCVFEWGSASNASIDENNLPHSFANDQNHLLINVGREDAARRTGIERVANIGTGCIAYRIECFEKFPPPWYAYTYNRKGTAVLETEECCFHRRLYFAGVPIYVHWDHWAQHKKDMWVGKPRVVTDEQIEALHLTQRQVHEKLAAKDAAKKSAQGVISIQVPACEACGSPHNSLEFRPFRDQNNQHTHFALCPVNGTPLLRRRVSLEDTRKGNTASFRQSMTPPNGNGNGNGNGDRAIGVPVTARDGTANILAMLEILPPIGLEPHAWPFEDRIAVRWAQSIGGWMTKDELTWLAQRANELPENSVWVEVGTWRGRSLAAVALAASKGMHITAVDSWEGVGMLDGPGEMCDPKAAYENWKETWENLCRLRPDLGIFFIKERSTKVAASRADYSCDVVFIDALHDYLNARADIEAWLPKIKPGGLICGHDAFDDGVRRALEDVFGPREEILQHGPGGIWFVRINVDLLPGVVDMGAAKQTVAKES
jgi:methyltransferase family protein